MGRRVPVVFSGGSDRVFVVALVFLSSGVIALTVATAVVIWWEAKPAFTAFGYVGFLSGQTWDPVAIVHGAAPFILGTLLTSFLALALAVIPALAVAIFVSEYAPAWLAETVNYAVDLLAAIPSVLVGLWAVFNFAPAMRDSVYMPIYRWAEVHVPQLLPVLGTPTTYNLATATIIIALMIVPYTVALSRDAILLVPPEQREAAYALGCTRWEVMVKAVLPYARTGVIAGILLSLARALGETMAVAMLIGSRNRLPFTLFGPAVSMPSLIINEFREAVEPLHYSSVMAVGFCLFVLTMGINLAAGRLQRKLSFGQGVL